MGLHLNYELRLPITTPEPDVDRALANLREFALAQPFEEVSALMRWTSGEPQEDDGWPAAVQLWARVVASAWDEEKSPKLHGDPSSARVFFVNPGRGCETAAFGFLARGVDMAQPSEWFWWCGCKTQYASVVSDDHLIKCHTGLVRVLDHALASGLEVTVRDETRYWDTRDVSQLLDEVHRMNRIVARIAGVFGDAVSETLGDSLGVHAPIFEHPRFERLEMGE